MMPKRSLFMQPGQRFGELIFVREIPPIREGKKQVLRRYGVFSCNLCKRPDFQARLDKVKSGKIVDCNCRSRYARNPDTIEKAIERIRNRIMYQCHGSLPSKQHLRENRIQVCNQWLRYGGDKRFLEWALPRYKPGQILLRKDQARGFTPLNCYFAYPPKRIYKQRKSLYIVIMDDKNVLSKDTIAAYAEMLEIPYIDLYKVFRYGQKSQAAIDALLRFSSKMTEADDNHEL